MNKKIAFIVLVMAQFYVPAWMIASQETVLNKGVLYNFKTVPVDPYDIFRGRYVALSTDQRSVELENVKNVDRGQTIYVIVDEDDEGFAEVKSASLSRPKEGDYIKTKVNYRSGGVVHFNLPINRYYMNDKKAPKAEALYRRNNRRQKQNAYVAVRVLNGKALIEGLYVGGKTVESYF